jgi:uncharacterized membrane protein
MTSPGITSEAARLRAETLRTKTLRTKTWICATVVVLTNVFGNFFMKRGLPASLDNPFEYIAALFRPQVALGVALLILWMLSRMTLLSWADLSYVVPVTSIGYVLVALMGRIFLDERITARNWVGIALIVAGVSMVGRGTPQTSPGNPPGAVR